MSILPEIPRFYTAFAEWGACLVYILLLNRKRSLGWRERLKTLAVLIVQAGFLVVTQDISIVLWIPTMIAAVLLMFLFIAVSSPVSLPEAGYYCVRAFVLAELIASFQWQIHCLIWGAEQAPLVPRFALLFGIYYLAFAVVYTLERRLDFQGRSLQITGRELISCATIGIAVFSVSNLSFLSIQTPFSGQYSMDIYTIRTIVDFSGVVMLFAYHSQRHQLKTRQELEAVQNVLNNQLVQYQQYKETSDLISRKYHDLKHQIAILRGEKDDEKRNSFLDEMEQEIKTFEAQNKTGNQVLDTILTTKALYCVSNQITLTCVVDGELLHFIDTMDVCSMFGNALDNAIEHVEQISDPQKRLIHLSVSAQKAFLVIAIENYCEQELETEDDLPVSTKGSRDFHGYGLKSIRFIAKKYGGTMTVTTRDCWFDLNIMIPMNENENP